MKTYFKPRVYRERKFKVRTYNQREFLYKRAEVEHNFLKYIRVVRAWARLKHKINYAEFEMLCFLYSESIFTEAKFMEYRQIFGFNNKMFWRMVHNGQISTFRKHQRGYEALYELSMSSKAIMRSIYKKLLGTEPLNEFVTDIQLYKKKDSTYTERQYSRVIKSMKKDFKAQQQRQPPLR
jgi:hypothetical protein